MKNILLLSFVVIASSLSAQAQRLGQEYVGIEAKCETRELGKITLTSFIQRERCSSWSAGKYRDSSYTAFTFSRDGKKIVRNLDGAEAVQGDINPSRITVSDFTGGYITLTQSSSKEMNVYYQSGLRSMLPDFSGVCKVKRIPLSDLKVTSVTLQCNGE